MKEMHRLTKPQSQIYELEKFAKGSAAIICGSMVRQGKRELVDIENVVEKLYGLNDALRIRIVDTDQGPMQRVAPYTKTDTEILYFTDQEELERYAGSYAKEPLDLYGSLCEIKIIQLPDRYGLLIKLHHMIADAWTLSLIGSQFCGMLDGKQPEAYSYMDCIGREDAYLHSQRYGKDRDFFLEQFRDCDEPVYLSEKQGLGLRAERRTFVLDPAETSALREYANKSKTSVFALFLTAFSVCMSRIRMNADRFYVGTAVLNRAGAREKNTLGMFVNTVPFLVRLDYDSSFAENLASAKQGIFSAFRHQKYHYQDLLSDIRGKYDFRGQLYDVVLNYQNAVILGGETPFESSWYHSGMQTESLQIHIEDRDQKGSLRVHFDYQTEKFQEKEMEGLYGYMRRLLLDAIARDSRKLYELEMLSASERNLLLEDFNRTAIDFPREKCVHQLFEEQAMRTPDRKAVIACDRTLTYAQLNKQAGLVARGLRAKGVEEGDLVAFALSRKSTLLITILGILKAGAAFMPVDLEYPKDRVEYILEDSKAKLFLTDDSVKELLEQEELREFSTAMPSGNICYCIYTSGTTGNPKGALLTHRNVVNHCLANTYNICYESLLESCSCLLSVGTITFDIFSTEIFTALLNGLSLVLATEEEIRNAAKLGRLALRHAVDAVYCTPTKLLIYLEQREFARAMERVKLMMVAGEPFSAQQYREVARHTKAMIFNGYGPTETTMGVTFEKIETEEITIGRPIANTQIYLLDSYMQPVPAGVVGELCVAGEGVGAGYLNRPMLTAEKFIPNPFGKGKLYQTGDLARWQGDGRLIYVGRNDFQVKIRGLRIELGEIESAIAEMDGITQAVVVVRKGAGDRQMLCAFYTGQEREGRTIRAHIGKRLPPYMLPHSFTHLEEMPLTASGKTDRRRLPQVPDLDSFGLAEYQAAQTAEEQLVVSTLQDLLGVENVSVGDHFFDLGGDSLKAMEWIAVLEKAGYSTDVKSIFSCNTLEELAKTLKPVEREEEENYTVRDIPASPAQMRIYTAQSMGEDSRAYHVPYVFRVRQLDPDRLSQAVHVLLQRHEMLRTRFENRDGRIIQIVEEQVDFQVEERKNSDWGTFIRPFDLTKAPLMRIGFHENTVMIDMHHIITDGRSISIFMRELNEAYMGRKLGEKPASYLQFSLQSKSGEESESYWSSVYEGELPVLELNTDFKRKQKQSFQGSAVYDRINRDLHQGILAKCRELSITPYVFYMSGFTVMLSKFSGNEDLVVGIPVSGRKGPYLDTIGMFVNTVALRCRPAGTKTVETYLGEVKEASAEAIKHQDYSYGELVKKLGLHSTERNPLFDVMFAYQSKELSEVVFGDQRAELLPVPIETSKYDFTFYMIPGEEDVTVTVEYCSDLYREDTIGRFLKGYQLVLQKMLAGDCLLRDISVLTEQEERLLRTDFNHTGQEYLKNTGVHTLFEEQVQRKPEETAVIACDGSLTYGEVNELANRIAHGLLSQGIVEGDLVAFLLPRRSFLIAVMLGILKAGAAYMPMDPGYPKDRLSYMLEDSGARFCITKDNLPLLWDNPRRENPEIPMAGDSLCYCIYISGSTGKPKGTLLTHRNVLNYVNNNNNNNNVVHKIIREDYKTILSVTTVGFDIFVTESLLPLANGLQILLANEKQATIQSELQGLLRQHPVDVMQTTPTKMRSLIRDPGMCGYLRGIKAIILGGEALDGSLVRELRQYTKARIFNIYGPTETTVWSTNKEVLDTEDITLGKPIANTQIYITDPYGNLAPIGTTGELWIGGDGVGAGYLNRPELTRERFIENPFGEGRLYRTGDLAYWRRDGNLVYVGRNDFQVKIRGLRIELGEIESAICSVKGVSQAVAVVQKEDGERQVICAFYTEAAPVDQKEIKRVLRESLPRYMMPHVFTLLPEMPLTSSGKINRKGLPKAELKGMERSVEYAKPEGELEKQLAALAEQVLELSPVGREDDFFDLGGDSLRAIEFVSQAHSQGIYFELQTIFDCPTVRQLAAYIEKGDKQELVFDQEDFFEINRILDRNRIERTGILEKKKLGNILLTGATGYLGIHILAEFMEHDEGTAYCLVRGKDVTESARRFENLREYYFGDKYKGSPRIRILSGDFTEDKLGLSAREYKELTGEIQTVINAAASVKHYGSYSYFYETNVESVKQVIKLCQEADAKLIHVSTLSVSGNSFVDQFDAYVSQEEKHFYESSLYVGQALDNVYVRSKFEAEREVLEAMNRGLKANIMRMGNLTNRLWDGLFQKNYASNAFLKRVKAILKLGIFPEYLMELYLEFTPVDQAAEALMTIARHFNTDQTVFHLNSVKVIYMEQMHSYFERLGYPLKIVGDREFTAALRRSGEQKGMEFILETFINDLDAQDRIIYDSKIRIENDFTVWYLQKLGFTWADMGFEYLQKYMRFFEKLGYWEE